MTRTRDVSNVLVQPFAVDTMSNEQKHIINQIKVCQAKANSLKAELQIFEVSLQGFTNALIKSVEPEEAEAAEAVAN